MGGGGAQWPIAPLKSKTMLISNFYFSNFLKGLFLSIYFLFVLSFNLTHILNRPTPDYEIVQLREAWV